MPPTGTPRVLVPTPLVPPVDAPESDDMFAGLKVVPARELQQDAWCMLAYSHGGAGKTTLAGMFADYEPARDVLIVDAEGGSTAVSNKDHVYAVQVSKWAEIERIVTKLERTPKEQIRWKTVVFDNLSEMQTIQMQTVTTGEIGIQHWGMNTAAMLRFARRVRNLARYQGINIVLLAWQNTSEDEYSKVVRHGVSLTNKLASTLPGIVNVVGHLSILNNPPLYTRRLSFAASPTTDAKFRRAAGDSLSEIPLEIYYGINDNPIVDILASMYEGKPFPVQRYQRPKNARASSPVSAQQEAAKDDHIVAVQDV